MKLRRIRAIAAALAIGLTCAGPPARAVEVDDVDWTAVLRALGVALDSWRLSPFPRMTPTPTNPPPTATPTPTNTPVPTNTPTRTLTFSPTPIPTEPEAGQLAFGPAPGLAPPQRLASALLIFPYLVHNGGVDTRLTLINMSDRNIGVNCFFVRDAGPVLGCLEIGFRINLTPLQPFSWFAGEGTNNPLTFTAAPPFDGVGELRCAVDPDIPDLVAHNVLQGRATVFEDSTGDTVAYGAVGFQRRIPGNFPGSVPLDGFTYDQCPERLHFQVLTRPVGGPVSSMVLTPCQQDLLTQTPTSTAVQMQIVNEFEQVFSSSTSFTCHAVISFSSFSTLSKSTLGTDTAHLVLRGVSSPLVGLVIDRFKGGPDNSLHISANDPYLEGGKASTVIFP
jgi:hypothetical protein